jgi:hypothetical protein
MTADKKSLGDTLAFTARMLILTGIGVLAILIATTPNANPLSVKHAQAEGGIAAAPGYIALTTNGSNAARFYLVNSAKQVICVYTLNGGQLRLVAARKFDHDRQIFDASISVVTPEGISMKAFEGTDGLDRSEAKGYAEGLKKLWEQAQNQKK